MRISRRDHITNETELKRSDLKTLSDIVAERTQRLIAHILRLSEPRRANTSFFVDSNQRQAKEGTGRPRITWRSTFKRDMNNIQIEWTEVKTKAVDRNSLRR